jgi:hypothetical protein
MAQGQTAAHAFSHVLDRPQCDASRTRRDNRTVFNDRLTY